MCVIAFKLTVVVVVVVSIIIIIIIIIYLVQSTAFTLIVLFDFACLIRHNGNSKGKKAIFLQEQDEFQRCSLYHILPRVTFLNIRTNTS
jgi:hypothetical protein